ncbi:MAG TPA: hypothetical protein VKZ49_17025 [Polyangiaceae bacterium]|nr:hypothetical protein [Polyangiaceae bacterium]
MTIDALGTALPATLLAFAGDFFWDNPIFSRDNWSAAMDGFRVGLGLVAAALLIYAARARRMGVPVRKRTQRNFAILLTVLGFGAYFDFGNPNTRYSEYYHRHEFFHYYLGSKYFEEIGYTRLYECAAVAETELGRASQVRSRELRDLRVNLIKPIPDTYVFSNPAECKQHFTPERWEAWKKDVDWFYRSSAGTYWENMQKDHGYNPPPVWTMAGKFFSSFGVADDGFFKALSAIDVLLHAGIVVLLYWAFGWKIGAIATVFWGINAPANFYWTGGAFMRQDWIFLLVASVCLARKRYFALAGAALTWSALLRVFPAILFAGWGIIIGIHLLKKRFFHPDHKRLIAGCVVAAGILIPASVVVSGPNSYKEFVEHISVHKNTPLTNHMGLETMLTHNWDGRMRFTRNDALDDPFQEWKQGRLDRAATLKPLQLAIIAGLFAWMIWALRRTKLLWLGPAMSLPLCISIVNITCYYYSMFLVAAVVAATRPPLGPVLLVGSAASQMLLTKYYWVDDKFTAQSWLWYLLGVLVLYSYSRPFTQERLKAWWHGRPEPLSARQERRLDEQGGTVTLTP